MSCIDAARSYLEVHVDQDTYHVSNIWPSDSKKPHNNKGRENFPYNQHNAKRNELHITDIFMNALSRRVLVFDFPLKDTNNRFTCISQQKQCPNVKVIPLVFKNLTSLFKSFGSTFCTFIQCNDLFRMNNEH